MKASHSTLVILCAALLMLCHPKVAHVSPLPTLSPVNNLPDKVYFRTATESFNRRYYVALRKGSIWFKPNEETTGIKDEWQLLGKTGKPDASFRFGTPAEITAISADGIHLMARSESGVFYRGTNLTSNISRIFNWDDRWGWWGAKGPGLKDEIHGIAWCVSDAFPLHLKYYEDANGQKQGIGFGVAHLYYLSADGTKIYFNDWWLPADWSRQVATPLRGTFRAINLSASGSTIFIIGQNGQMYTRMYDFDISGENPLLTYSYVKSHRHGTTRKLPPPNWALQPPITTGKYTGRITIFQNGQGNAARVLRVEGEQEGKTGFFYKNIFDSVWSFQQTGLPLDLPFVDKSNPALPVDVTSPFDRKLQGTLLRADPQNPLQLEFVNFNIGCPPAKVRPLIGGQMVKRHDGTLLEFTFYHTQTLVTSLRPVDFWDCGQKADIWGALLIPHDMYRTISDENQQLLSPLIGKRKVINFIGTADRESIDMKEISLFQKGPAFVPLFIVPGNEKCIGTPFHLQARTR